MCVVRVINQRTVSINVILAVARGLRGLWAKHPKHLELGATSIVNHNDASEGVEHYASWKSADVEATRKACCMWLYYTRNKSASLLECGRVRSSCIDSACDVLLKCFPGPYAV